MRLLRLTAILAFGMVLAACDTTTDPHVVTRPQPIVLTPKVNIQLGDTPAGLQPFYIVTGEARATQQGRTVGAAIDSVVVYYQVGESAWLRRAWYSQVPISGHLPFIVGVGEQYSVWARLYARGFTQTATVYGSAEWVATGFGY